MNPIGDEVALVGFLPRVAPEVLFPGCRRAGDADPCLENHKQNHGQMDAAEPAIAHPIPLQHRAKNGQDQPHFGVQYVLVESNGANE